MKKRIKLILSNLLSFLPDKEYCTLTFLLKHGRLPNFKKNGYFNDKLLHLKLNDRNPILKQLVDKYEVRSYVSSKIGEEFLVPLIGVYADPSEVDFNNLPPKFALKPTSGAQQNIICKDKASLDWDKSSKKIRQWLRYDPYQRTREWPYKDLQPRFVIERFIEDSNGRTYDYKFWCFNGEPKLVQIDLDRFEKHKRNIYYAKGFKQVKDLYITYEHSDHEIKKPKNYLQMIEIATKLSEGFTFVRVDLYNIDGRIYFGEMTFYPGNCNEKITPIEYEKNIGGMLPIE